LRQVLNARTPGQQRCRTSAVSFVGIAATALQVKAGLLRLTTILAHSSGEWISSEWPVCQVADVASAQRMGAALTYARRYALFTLVGIAGEDDVDAPDLGAGPAANGQAAKTLPTASGTDKLPGRSSTVLAEQLSATLRDSLIQKLAAITSADDAAVWARRNLPAKNALTAADAKLSKSDFRRGSPPSAMDTSLMGLLTARLAVCLMVYRPSTRLLSRSKAWRPSADLAKTPSARV